MKHCKLLPIYIILLTVFFQARAQNNCEVYTTTVLQRLPQLLLKNDFAQLKNLTTTWQNVCGETELAQRLQIIEKLIQKEQTAQLISHYIAQGYDDKLVNRHDHAAQKNYARLYGRNKATFDFIPLRHSVDSLIQVKATALLHSPTYTLNREEEAICLLFADEVDLYYNTMNKKPKSRPFVDAFHEREDGKHKTAGILYSGVFMPIGGNDYLRTSPTFGITIMSPLSGSFVFELGVKLRINTNNATFDFVDEGQIKEIHSNSSYFLGANLGYKVFDKGSWIVLPKIGTGLGFINTNLSRTSVYDVITTEEEDISGIRYNNVNTLHNVAGIAIMRHIKRKMYLGLECNYHLVPYNWDESLLTRINSKFCSIELFFRF